jgi:hypothetical protein
MQKRMGNGSIFDAIQQPTSRHQSNGLPMIVEPRPREEVQKSRAYSLVLLLGKTNNEESETMDLRLK